NHRIAVRPCADYAGLDERYFRVAVRSAEDNARLLAACQAGFPAVVSHRRPALMLQGTCSNAGKSVLCAAFCRILLQDGFSVAPFKAQNMSLNSYVTPDGGEIGRAQAVQAEACRLDPDVRMNPILLKPDSDLGSQVVVLGHPIGNYRVRDYFRKKRELWGQVTEAYDSLSAEHDCIVLEGAGSPGEINLKGADVVNMRMARHAEAAVLLVGDIDRGGVYASFLGAFQTFEPWERRLLHGFLVNKFRGDPTLLAEAHAWLERMTDRPVLGVIDYQPDLGLPEEDSVNFSFVRPVARDERTLDVALIALGHTANFTDFAPLEAEPDVRLRIVHSVSELGTPDLLILPGSKNVPGDMAALEASGLAAAIRSFPGPVVAICGGLQMLGQACHDPLALESGVVHTPCLGLLPFETTLRREKTVRRTSARLPDGTAVFGYEIHHGETISDLPPIVADDGRAVGFVSGRFFATYLHGVFDDDSFRRSYLDGIRALKGWPPRQLLVHYGLEESLDRLATHVRSRVDMGALYRKLGL
ncbi:MAG: cobyric acid synthase, partial [Victivallales bacterium]|nr:cobyric acid synthase [Victivallales bacterium]